MHSSADGRYQEPPRAECDVDDFEAALTGPPDEFLLHVNWWTFRRQVARFSIELIEGPTRNVLSRIDTCHGTIHRHVFLPDGVSHQLEFETIPADHGWQHVHRAYPRYFTIATSQWPEWVREWRS